MPEKRLEKTRRAYDDDRDSAGKPCLCNKGRIEDCPKHGIAASNARQNRYWQRVGGHD